MDAHFPASSAYQVNSPQYDSRLNDLVLNMLVKQVIEHRHPLLSRFRVVLRLAIVLRRD